MLDETHQAILDLASRQVRVTTPDGRRIRVTLFEARLLELASPDCRRRILCQDFITQVRNALLGSEIGGI
ncbi:hypothetical protein IWY39_002835 [Sphingobium sp. JAI105]|uniref:hypothetical protein n=1 Tax=Sphingobium sp. JAI105 TaxID=2787715 RepID=UPI0018C9B621|nr:hypothetical protein [Sphingobium sp. JAI105]MBG6119031.1 hypothetical protein [Sphingobium sp. JAI105]